MPEKCHICILSSYLQPNNRNLIHLQFKLLNSFLQVIQKTDYTKRERKLQQIIKKYLCSILWSYI